MTRPYFAPQHWGEEEMAKRAYRRPSDLPQEVEQLVCKGWHAVVRLTTIFGIFPSKEDAERYQEGIYQMDPHDDAPPVFVIPESHAYPMPRAR